MMAEYRCHLLLPSLMYLWASTTAFTSTPAVHSARNNMELKKQAMFTAPGFIRSITFESRRKYSWRISFSHSDSTFAEDEEEVIAPFLFDKEEEDEYEIHNDAVEMIRGSSDGLFVTKQYSVPLEGFPVECNNRQEDMLSISSIFSDDDVKRLSLSPCNVTLPAALMLLDPEKYTTQSRARKSIRQRTICICRNYNNQTYSFNELGKVISRVYPGDMIGHQTHYTKSNYYAVEGVPYRPPAFELPVVYEDNHMAIVNKPAGIVTYRSEGGRGSGAKNGGHGRDTLLSALPYYLQPSEFNAGSESTEDYFPRPQPVHRLDRPTSGMVCIAKTKAAAIHLSQQFEYRKAKKTYFAIVNGVPSPDESQASPLKGWNTIDYDLEEKSAITKWRVVQQVQSLYGKNGQLSLVEMKPKTGRYHQLRRHMAWVCKTPLVGDTTYDGGDDSAMRLRGRGLFLCSNEIELEHPYYNTPAGRKEWLGAGPTKKRCGDAVLYMNQDTDTVMIKASISLPDKFESFLKHEHERSNKFN